MRVLLVEDEEDAAQIIATGLRQQSYQVDVVGTGELAVERAVVNAYDLVILDIRLPRMNGWQVCLEMRESGLPVPILMLTASGSYPDRIKGLDLGADDYLVKPFDFGELLARVRALLRRGPSLQRSVIRVGTLEVNLRSRTARRNGRLIPLTAKEYALLECLIRDAHTLLTRNIIAERVWNEAYDPSSNVIEEYIKRLRRKVEVCGTQPLIQARRGEGYILTDREFA
jgi:two-component system copper resistance phosphate regulon response regulator CusR